MKAFMATGPIGPTARTFARPAVCAVVRQHVDDLAALRLMRAMWVRAPHVRMLNLRRIDGRIAAHMDGVLAAGATGRKLCVEALATPGVGEVFGIAAVLLESLPEHFGPLVALAQRSPDARRGLLSAFGWSNSVTRLQPLRRLDGVRDASVRALAICGYRVLGCTTTKLPMTLHDDLDPQIRTSLARAAGELGMLSALPAVLEWTTDSDIAVAFHAVRTACLLGAAERVGEQLRRFHAKRSPWLEPALALSLLSAKFVEARDVLRRMEATAAEISQRQLIRASGWVGDPLRIPALIDLMANPRFARVAGEAFSLITGVDMAYLDLDRKPPKEPISGPTDDPASDDVALDEDESLPWPDPQRIKAWWHANADRFPPGQRYFCGAPPTPEHALHVLKTGFQRQRALAAIWRCVLQPGTPLFNIAAPAWRQEAELAALS